MDEMLNTLIGRIVQSINPDRIILCGSRGRGQEGPHSDYDFLILKRDIDNRRTLSQQLYRTFVDVPAAVDILVETPEKVEKHRDTQGFVYAEAAKGRVVYER
ncbi:Nucleotidyltransferase domain protein [Acididesulfobacillus acetoxydans]|uniref:GrpB/Dephospho-CoA kinase n=2 Tax=Acididesulfobacillus acetoxydans TaxID=1561005 RepID=A0A8S0W4S2_9FIRM|nr:Nucleotidyltransferase domain protein [Acididesulfobacillus acetoxydans]CEJ07265.1 GrpB/Dephospho-CoA kinase [Acididesulfobacillus acetoxydans]